MREVKIDCYMLCINDLGLKKLWIFKCKLHPSTLTDEEIREGLEAYLTLEQGNPKDIKEIRVEKKTLTVKVED